MSVLNLKRDLADLIFRGRAGCVAGIIVSEYLWARLAGDFSEGFDGRMGVSGIQGNRKLRYEFYVLRTSTFPKQQHPGGYFFVPFDEGDYRARILGHEVDGTLVSRSCCVEGREFRELNPVTGEVWMDDRRVECVDFNQLVVAVEAGCAMGKSVREQIGHFWYWGFTFRKPDEVVWLRHPERYDYHRADLVKSVGRLLMRRVVIDDQAFFDIVGIALSGHQQIVEVQEPRLRFEDVHKFSEWARYYFLPEEIMDFLARFGLSVGLEELVLDPLYEPWGHQADLEAIGRLKKYVSSSRVDGSWDLHSVSGYFIGSRGVEYSLSLCSRVEGVEWVEFEAEHFPTEWQGWPDTSKDRALKSLTTPWLDP